MQNLVEDVRFGWRMLRRNPAISIAAILTLAIGIGATTSIFSVTSAVLLRAFPYPEADHLAVMVQRDGRGNEVSVNRVDFEDLRRDSKQVAAMALYRGVSVTLGGSGDPVRLRGLEATASMLDTLGLSPVLGLGFSAEDDTPGARRSVLISHGFWQQQFGGAPEVLGEELLLDGEVYTVRGVLPAALEGEALKWYPMGDLWLPFGLSLPDLPPRRGYGAGHLALVRFEEGGTLEGVLAELNNLSAALAVEFPNTNQDKGVVLRSIREEEVGDIRPALLTAMGAIAFVLLIGCANVANLQLARAGSREREISVRTALGASRGRLLRQLLTESLILALVGGALGTAAAVQGVRIMAAALPETAAVDPQSIRLEPLALLFALGLSLLTGVFFGLAPAARTSRAHPQQALHEGAGGRTIGNRRSRRLTHLLVVGEVALALVLLVGATLMVRSLSALKDVDPGFDPSGLLTLRIPLPDTRYSEVSAWLPFYRELLTKIRAEPGVEAVSASSLLPLTSGSSESLVVAADKPFPRRVQDGQSVLYQMVSPSYFETLGIELLKGRLLSAADRDGAPPVAVIDETMARILWPGEDPLGKRLAFEFQRSDPNDPGPMYREVVGVVRHVRHYRLSSDSRVELYVSLAQPPFYVRTAPALWLALRGSGSREQLASLVRKNLRDLDPEIPIFAVRDLEGLVARGWGTQDMMSRVLSAFSTVALLLAALGLYGVVSFSVSQRTREIGIRMALGADRLRVLSMVLRQGLALGLGGITVGLAAALLLRRALSSQLYGVDATDASMLGSLAAFLLLTAVTATLLPAMRGTRIQPVVALRED